jgi:hypothetical protein
METTEITCANCGQTYIVLKVLGPDGVYRIPTLVGVGSCCNPTEVK